MSKIAHYLQEHLNGEVLTSADVREFFAHDASVLSQIPSLVVYVQNENDIRKTARFTWQLAERGRVVPITARGGGTDYSGAAIGSGIIMVFPAHLNRILELDSKTGSITVEPGINYGKLQQTLHTHGRFLPPYPASIEFSTIGGAVANNAAGERSIKYGSMREYVKHIRVVLANGEVITTGRISKRELNKKLGLASLEGEIYRQIDALIEDNQNILGRLDKNISKNSVGYALNLVKRKDGSFDLTPLMVGSQGTLGLISEITLETEIYNPTTTLVTAYFDDLQVAEEIIREIRSQNELPAAVEAVDANLLNFVQNHNPNYLKGVIEPPFPNLVMLIEYDNQPERHQKRQVHKLQKILNKFQVPFQVETDEIRKELLWKIRQSAAVLINHSDNNQRALPFIEDAIVPIDMIKRFFDYCYELFTKHNLEPAIWGHAADGNFHIMPILDLSQVGDRQKLFKVMTEFSAQIIEFGGSISGQHGEGRIRGSFISDQYGDEVYKIMQSVKQIFDPLGTFNPGVKVNIDPSQLKNMLKQIAPGHRHLHHLPSN